MLLIITAWIFLYLIIQGYGFIAKKILSAKDNVTFIEQFWFGLALFLGILQLTSLIFPLRNHVFYVLSAIGLLFLLADTIYNPKKYLPTKLTPSISFVVFLLLSILAAHYAIQDVTWYDTFLYHFNSVRWIHDYPAIPGLANLHDRLGFNSVLFLLGAFVDNVFMSGNSVRITLPFLSVAMVASVLKVLFCQKGNIQQKIFAVTSILYIIAILLRGLVNSYSTDVASLIFVILFALYFLADKQNFRLLILFVILSVMFKLSAIPILVFLPYLLFKSKKVANNLLILGILGLGYISRNIIQTGWPLYPLPIFKLPFDWSVPANNVRFAANAIKAYTRMPGNNYLESLKMPFLNWFPIWFEKFFLTIEFKLFVFAIIISFISFSPIITKKYKNFKTISLILYSLLGLFYVFITAPSVRFASIYFYLFLSCALVPIVSYLYDKNIKHIMLIRKVLVFNCCKIYPIILLLIFFYLSFNLFKSGPNFITQYIFIKPSLYQTHHVYQKMLSNKIDVIYIPDTGNQCGDSPLPCTPYFNINLKYRKSGDIRQGFLLKND
ncbi:MAG: hypothetical protein ABH812_04300 [bacterium]